MSYYQMLNFSLEPFSNTPDPDFFFETRQHLSCLQKIELSVRLRRGLAVVLGEVGTGKTTLCRQLIRRFHHADDIETHLVLDPDVGSPLEFLNLVAAMITGQPAPDQADAWQLKEIIKNCLFRKGVDEGRTVVLILDEGQKTPPFCLELLREFLNYETNEHKLLQIVIFAQKELEDTLREHQNFADRINLYHVLEPLDFKDARMMIRHRLNRCSTDPAARKIFTFSALYTIYRLSGGYPRKIINLCHLCLMALIIKDQTRVDARLVRASSKRLPWRRPSGAWRRYPVAAAAVVVVAIAAAFWYKPMLQAWKPDEVDRPVSVGTATLPQEQSTPVGDSVNQTVQPAGVPSSGTAVLPAEDKAAVPAGVVRGNVEAGPPKDRVLQVSIKPGESLYWMAAKVYGTTSPRVIDLVCQANNHLGDFNRIAVGKTIQFPLIPADVSNEAKEYFYIQLLNTDSLNRAFDTVRALQADWPQTRIIPYWTPGENLRFAVIAPPVCYEESRARKLMAELPEAVAARAELASFSGGDYFYFADLFAVN